MQGFLWFFDDPIADLLLASTFLLVALQFRQLRLMQHRTDVLASEVYELKVLVRTIKDYVARSRCAPHGPGGDRAGATKLTGVGRTYSSAPRRLAPAGTKPGYPYLFAMAESFGNEFTIVEVMADRSDRPQLWVAVAKPDQAVTLVLSEVPKGWTADVLEAVLTEALLKDLRKLRLQPGELRKLTK